MWRRIKNLAGSSYSEAETKVRDATNNDQWGPSSSLMMEIADMTHDDKTYPEIMGIIWKRLNDRKKCRRHVYKSLILLEFIVKVGSEKVARESLENIRTFIKLKDFKHEENDDDEGEDVSGKAKQLIILLTNDELLKSERAKALMLKNGSQNVGGTSADETCQPLLNTSETRKEDSEWKQYQPTSDDEEYLQTQIALIMSIEAAEAEEKQRLLHDIKLQMTMNKSTVDISNLAGETVQSAANAANTNTLVDLVSFQMPACSVSSGFCINDDPWTNILPEALNLNNEVQDPWDNVTTKQITSLKDSSASAGIKTFIQPVSNEPRTSSNIAKVSDPITVAADHLPRTKRRNSANESLVTNISKDVTQHKQLRFTEQNTLTRSTNGNKITRQNKVQELFSHKNSSLVNLNDFLQPPQSLVSNLSQFPKSATGGVVGSFSSWTSSSKNARNLSHFPSVDDPRSRNPFLS